MKETCPICGNENKAVGRPCAKCVRIKQVDKMSKRKLLELHGITLPPRLFANMAQNFDYWQDKIDKYLKDVSNESAYISGLVGCGKTTMALTMLVLSARKRYVEKASTIMYVNVPKLIQDIKNSFDSGTTEHIIYPLQQSNWIVMDDLGAEYPTPWTRMIFYLIINERYEWGRTTVVTSNLSLKQLKTAYSDDPRIPSRLSEMCTVIQIPGKDKRITK